MATSRLQHRSKSQRLHTWAKRIVCPGCGREFRTESGFIGHHLGNPQFQGCADLYFAADPVPLKDDAGDYAHVDRLERNQRRELGKEKIQRIRDATQPLRARMEAA